VEFPASKVVIRVRVVDGRELTVYSDLPETPSDILINDLRILGDHTIRGGGLSDLKKRVQTTERMET
jgi:hypothetical protein